MAISYTHNPDGGVTIEIPAGETAHFLTQAELARESGRSPGYVKEKRDEGVISPLAVTGSMIELYPPQAVFMLARKTVERGGRMVETTALN